MQNFPLNGWIDLKPFCAWCTKVLPSVFDESMTYYEVLCKCIELLNHTMHDVNLLDSELQDFEQQVVQQFEELKNGTWIQGTIPYLEKLLEQYIPVAIFFGLTDSGYFVAYIPDSWDEITFNTSGYDTGYPCGTEYGQLILNY